MTAPGSHDAGLRAAIPRSKPRYVSPVTSWLCSGGFPARPSLTGFARRGLRYAEQLAQHVLALAVLAFTDVLVPQTAPADP